MSVGELILTLIACSIPCFFAGRLVVSGSPVAEKYHDDLGFVCIVVLMFLAFMGVSYAWNFDSPRGLRAAARAAVFSAFAVGMALRRCRKKETRISGGFFLFAAGYIITKLLRCY